MKNSENCLFTKKQLLTWLNDLLKIDVHSIQELSNGAAFCQLLDAFSQGCVRMQKINWNAKLQHQNLNNLKVLSTSMLALGIEKKFDAARISQRKTQDILELLQWFRKYFLSNHMPSENYDPISRRKSFSTQKHNNQGRTSLQNARKQKSIILMKPPLNNKKEPTDIINQQSQLQNCFKVNKEIQKILTQQNNIPAQKKLDLIKNIIFTKNRNGLSNRKQSQSISLSNQSQLQCSNRRTIPDKFKPLKNVQVQVQVKIEQNLYNGSQYYYNHMVKTPSNFQFNSSIANTSQILLQSEVKQNNQTQSGQKILKSDKKGRN